MDTLERADLNTLNIKDVEEKLSKKIAEWLKYYEKNSLGGKPEKRR
jgi:hypothetical protein